MTQKKSTSSDRKKRPSKNGRDGRQGTTFSIVIFDGATFDHGEVVNKETIQTRLKSSKRIVKYAFVRHDRESCDPHWQIAIWAPNKMRVGEIVRLFGAENANAEKQFKIKILGCSVKDDSRFMKYAEYLSHADPALKNSGKHQYPDDAIVANFNYTDQVASIRSRRDYFHNLATLIS